MTRQQTMANLRSLDVGFGYTADGGRTYPFRGLGVGLMPTLEEVLRAFPDKSFLINIKSRDASEGERLVGYLRSHGHPDARIWVFADDAPAAAVQRLAPTARVTTKNRSKACTIGYLALGWAGSVPKTCRGGAIGVPINLRGLYWGWPDRFFARMRAANVEVTLVGPLRSATGLSGVDASEDLRAVPERFGGVVLTDRIEAIGPEVRRRWVREPDRLELHQ